MMHSMSERQRAQSWMHSISDLRSQQLEFKAENFQRKMPTPYRKQKCRPPEQERRGKTDNLKLGLSLPGKNWKHRRGERGPRGNRSEKVSRPSLA